MQTGGNIGTAYLHTYACAWVLRIVPKHVMSLQEGAEAVRPRQLGGTPALLEAVVIWLLATGLWAARRRLPFFLLHVLTSNGLDETKPDMPGIGYLVKLLERPL